MYDIPCHDALLYYLVLCVLILHTLTMLHYCAIVYFDNPHYYVIVYCDVPTFSVLW